MDDDQPHSDPLGDVINLLAAPLASGIRSYEQFRRGVDELFRTVENLNSTMENLNETAERVNRLLADVEEPVRAMIPRITRTITAADELIDNVGGPAMQFADALTSPAFRAVPQRLDEFVSIMNDVSRRLGPLTSFAESAGSMFGLRRPGTPSPPPVTTPEPVAASPAPAEQSLAKKVPARKTTAKKVQARKAPAKKRAAKKRAARKKAAPARG